MRWIEESKKKADVFIYMYVRIHKHVRMYVYTCTHMYVHKNEEGNTVVHTSIAYTPNVHSYMYIHTLHLHRLKSTGDTKPEAHLTDPDGRGSTRETRHARLEGSHV